MDNNNLYTKGDKEEVIRRFDNIHTITMYCPILDDGMKYFRTIMVSNLNGYMESESEFRVVPTIDVFNCFMMTLDFCKDNNIFFENLYAFWGVVQSFKFLKYINIVFTDSEEVLESYCYVRNNDKKKSLEMISNIYHVDVLELMLSNLFNQEIIDMLNKTFIFDEIIENSYLKREFMIIFNFDEYISFIEMFTNNNGSALNELDENILDYLLAFPKLISRDKPVIRVITNYSNL